MASDPSPFTVEFQAEVFRYLTSSRRAMTNFADTVSPSFFTDTQLAALWGFVLTHWVKHRTEPSIGILSEIVRKSYSDVRYKDQLKTVSERMHEVYEITLVSTEFVEDRIREFIGYSAIKEATLACIDDLQEGRYNPDIVLKFQQAARAGQINNDIGVSARKAALAAIDNHADPAHNPPIPTGLHLLDRELGGGLRRGELGVFMAPPKGMKSTFLLNVAHHAPTIGVRKNCLYLTLELSEELQALRFGIRTTMLEKSAIIKNPKLYRSLYIRRAAAMFSPAHDCIFHFMPPHVCTPRKIRGILDSLIQDRGIVIDEMVVDYLELLGSDAKAEKEYMSQTRTATDLRQIAVDYNIAVWAASRTNRDANIAVAAGKWLSQEHVSGSFEKIAIVDVAIAGQRYRDGLAIVPVAFRNENGGNKLACKADGARYCLTTTHIIGEDDSPEPQHESRDGRENRPERKERKSGPTGAGFKSRPRPKES